MKILPYLPYLSWIAAAAIAFPLSGLSVAAQGTPKEHRVRDDAWRAQIRHQLYVPDSLPRLDTKVWSTFSPTPGVLADRVTYATADGMIVPAIVYRPDPKTAAFKGKLPGLVIVNGHGSDKFGWYAFYSGMMFAKAGAVVVTYDPIGEGERNIQRLSRSSSHDKDVTPPPPVPHDDWGRHLGGLMQVDLLQAVSYLTTQPEVDAKRIGIAGYSMGAFVAGIEGAYDLRVHAMILSGGGVFDGPGEYYDSNKLPCQGPPYHSLMVLGDRGAVLYDLHADRGPLLVQNGSMDTVMDIPHHGPDWFNAVRTRALALRGTDSGMFTTIFYPGISHRTSWVNLDGVKWFNQQLHFAFWNTDAKIDAAGITHVSTWAAANHVDISKSYIREDREGGLDAVGTGLPGIARADLMVLPDTDWERLKDQLTYESWAAKTMAAETRLAQAQSK